MIQLAKCEDDLRTAAAQLRKTETGRNTLKHLHDWLDESGLNLDCRNKDAAIVLLFAAWGEYAGDVLDVTT